VLARCPSLVPLCAHHTRARALLQQSACARAAPLLATLLAAD
jgi:hypothetical protein